MTKSNKPLFFVFVIIFSIGVLSAQDAPTGWSFGGVPAVAYNSDTGFLYGAILNFYNYGDGSQYPEYQHSTYLEWSRTTKGSGKNIIQFDSKYLLPWDLRITADLSYLTEAALPFYGFNGAESIYNSDFEDEDLEESGEYLTKYYYRHKRDILKFSADFQKKILEDYNLRALLGFGYHNTEIGDVDIEDETIDDEADELFSKYKNYELIDKDEEEGGLTNFIKLGLVFDTRDNEPNPMRGIWTETLVTHIPDAIGNDFSYTLLTATHRQYFTIIENDLSIAYRIAYQGVISGEIPFFMLPFYIGSYKTDEGFGGSKTLRGILKNRIVGNGVGFANIEARWKFLHTKLFGQDLYLALNAFVDAGQVINKYDNSNYVNNLDYAIGIGAVEDKDDTIHLAYGGGFRIALNQNFIVAVDFGLAGDEQDGTSGLYIGLGYLY